MSDTNDVFAANRTDKLRHIEELGIDPWGGRFDGHQPLGQVRHVAARRHAAVARAGGRRIIQRRSAGKAFFVDIWDWTGKIQIMIGQKQVGEQGWALAQELDLGDLIGVDGTLGKTAHGRADHLRREA